MTKRRDVPRLDLDPSVAAWRQRAVPNRAARTGKQRRDAARVRVRVDVPELVKAALAGVAGQQNTSASQMGAFLVAWGLVALLGGDEEMGAYLGDHCVVSRSIKVDVDLDLEPLLEILAKFADAWEE